MPDNKELRPEFILQSEKSIRVAPNYSPKVINETDGGLHPLLETKGFND